MWNGVENVHKSKIHVTKETKDERSIKFIIVEILHYA